MIDVDTIATDDDLAEELGGVAFLQNLIPDDWTDSAGQRVAKKARQRALDDVLLFLRRRIPPVIEADLRDPTELKQSVIYGAIERLNAMSMHSVTDVFGSRRAHYQKMFRAEVDGLNPTVPEGLRSPPASITVARR